MTRTDCKRWLKISLRTLHLLALAGVGGGVLFGLEQDLWLHYWWLALASGGGMMMIDWLSNPRWIVQVRGVAIVLKLILLLSLAWQDGPALWLLLAALVISGVISHAPGKVRYYSLYHRKAITSDADILG